MKIWTSVLSSLTILFFLASSPAFANNPENPEEDLRSNILKFIDNPDADMLRYYAESAEIDFVVNMHYQLVVLSVDGVSDELSDYIKKKLNYKKIKVRKVQRLAPYHVKITFLKE